MQRIKHAERGHHGHLKNGARPPEHGIWKKMLQKCYNERCAEFKHCGVLGIHVCDRWRGTDGFVNFLADVGPPPFSGVGLCRIDPNGHFAPGNVEWGDTRTKHMLTYEGRTLSLADWALEVYMNERTLRARWRLGWTPEAILTRPLESREHLAFYGTRKKHKLKTGHASVA